MAPSTSSSASSLPSVLNKPRHADGIHFLFSATGRSMQSLTSNVLSRLPFSPFNPNRTSPAAPSSPLSSAIVTVPLFFSSPSSTSASCHRSQSHGVASPSSAIRNFSSGVRIEGLVSSAKGAGGPAFVGQVFSMLDPSGNGLMAVTTRFDIPFLTKRIPEWIKKILVTVTNSEQRGPVFRFFMDLNDAVTYVRRLNIPSGMVGACRLDVAYEHFKEKPHMFQFVPNRKQVKAANKLLKQIPGKCGRRKVNGVPVFTAQNLNIAIATNDGIKWYAPYFFDKSLLDNILEASLDQHFHTLIQNRHMQRRRDVIDDSFTSEVFEEFNDSLFEPPEVQELLDEMGQVGIPLSVISKAAEIQLLDVVDKALLGNKWLRKATGIQPKFPYLVYSFEERSAMSFSKAALSATAASSTGQNDVQLHASEVGLGGSLKQCDVQSSRQADFQFPFANWFLNPWSRQQEKGQSLDNARKSNAGLEEDAMKEILLNPLLPKITMLGISMGDGGQVSKASLKKTLEELTKQLEQASDKSKLSEDKDPLFIANVGDYSSITRMNSS